MKRIKVINNKAIRDELSRLAEKNGRLTEDLVVAASRSPKSPLHSMFMWDDPDSAAHLGRLEIARQLIVKIRIEPNEQQDLKCEFSVRKWHGVGNGYRSIGDVLTQEKLREGLLRTALEDLNQMLKRYEMLAELAPVRHALDVVVKRSKRVVRKERELQTRV
mgnify:CR=1 FL=1